MMMYDFNADDIFEMAEQLERNGAAFYRNAAKAGRKRSKPRVIAQIGCHGRRP